MTNDDIKEFTMLLVRAGWALPADADRIVEDLTHEVAFPTLAGRSIEDVECEAIKQTLILAGGKRRKAAAILQIGERTLHRKIKTYNLETVHCKNNCVLGLAGRSAKDIECETIKQTLVHTAGNRERTAAILQISNRSLYRKLKLYNLEKIGYESVSTE